MTSDTTIKSLDVGMLKGQINGVQIKVNTGFGDGPHRLAFYLDERSRGSNEIAIQSHKHPWGEKLKTSTAEPEDYADDIRNAREAAWSELEKRSLDNPNEWHQSNV